MAYFYSLNASAMLSPLPGVDPRSTSNLCGRGRTRARNSTATTRLEPAPRALTERLSDGNGNNEPDAVRRRPRTGRRSRRRSRSDDRHSTGPPRRLGSVARPLATRRDTETGSPRLVGPTIQALGTAVRCQSARGMPKSGRFGRPCRGVVRSRRGPLPQAPGRPRRDVQRSSARHRHPRRRPTDHRGSQGCRPLDPTSRRSERRSTLRSPVTRSRLRTR